jgi:hypothetical protein
MDPFTVALAVFGVQKLRGKSTSRSFRDALLAAGGVQLGASAGIGGLQGFSGLGATGTNALAGEGFLSQLGNTFAGSGIKSLIGTSPVLDPTTGAVTKAGTGFMGLSPSEKAITSLVAAPAVTSVFADEEEPVKPPFTEADYQAAYARQPKLSLTEGTGSITKPVSSIYSYQQPNPMYYFNQGGIVSALPRYAQGGINYLPSKVTHDENDVHNYVRATGYVEDGSGNGDKDEDTILAQLADGEFVSRADAVLGAGIMAGASPGNMKDMRAKGASYFYEQQARFKRIFDLLNASRKVN